MDGWRARAVVPALVLLIAVAAAGCSRPGAFTAHNVLLISVDGLRGDRLGCTGDPAARTPLWDRLARQGGQFRTMISSGPQTRPAHATLLTGMQPWQHGARHDAARAVSPEPSLAEILRGAGLATAAFVGAGASGLEAGFESWTPGDRPADAGLRDARDWLDSLDASRRFFLFVNLTGATAPFEPAAPWERTVSDPNAVAATDRALARFLHALESAGRLDRTMIVATSPHGTAFGEHGERGHGDRLHETTLRVPLVLWGPMPFRGGTVRSDLARTVDVLPTVLEAMRVGTRANRPGRALQIRLKPYRERALAAYSETFGSEGALAPAGRRALRVGPWKLVRSPEPALFHLPSDPNEEHDLHSARPEQAAELSRRLEELLGDDLARPAGLGE